MKRFFIVLIIISILTSALSAEAKKDFNPDPVFAQVKYVKITRNADDSWSFAVTVRHKDEGWDHYADLWFIEDPESHRILAERVLAHPHDTEQPFTRSLNRIKLPPGQKSVIVRASCTRHEALGRSILINLNETRGLDYEISNQTGR